MNASRIQGSSGSAKDSIIHRNGSGFPGDSDSKESACDVGGLSSIPGLGRCPRGGHGNPLQFSCLENPHGQRSLVGCSPWGCKELNMTERLSIHVLWGAVKSISFIISCRWEHLFNNLCGVMGSTSKHFCCMQGMQPSDHLMEEFSCDCWEKWAELTVYLMEHQND